MAKINDEQLRNIPISFSKVQEYESDLTDSRFTEVLIKILHLGKNYNGSVFKKSVVESAIPTLANTPILGFIEPNKDNVDDFSDHRIALVNDNGEQKLRYMGHAYGVISQSQANEAYFQDDLCSDGIIRTYLYVKGLLFNKFDYVIDLFNSHNGTYNQSMELSDNYSGTFDCDEGGFVFDSFTFDGCCLITCNPAMIGSEITTNFSTETTSSISQEIENKLNEFVKYFSKKEDEKENMAKKKIEETIEQSKVKVEAQVAENFAKEEPVKENFDANTQNDDAEEDQAVVDAIEDVVDKLDNIEDAIDGGKDEDEEDFAKKTESDTEDTTKEEMACGGKDKENMSKEDGKKKYTLTFSLSYEDIRNQIYDKLYDMENIENTCYGIVETKDSYFIYADYCTSQFYKQSYIKDDTSIAFTGEREEIFNVFVDQETKDAIASVTYSKLQKDLEEANAKIQEYSVANTKLLAFQSEIKENERKAEINGVISRFSKVDALDLEKYKQQAYNKEISNEQLEEKLFAHMGRMNFSTNSITDSKEVVQAPINYSVSLVQENKEDDFVYGDDIKKYFK